MSIFLCDSNGDFTIAGNVMALTDGPQEVLQLIRNNLRFFKGEEPLNPDLGVPYFQQILDKQTPIAASQAILQQVVAETAGVLSVVAFTLDIATATRKATVTFTVTTKDGPITSTETFP